MTEGLEDRAFRAPPPKPREPDLLYAAAVMLDGEDLAGYLFDIDETKATPEEVERAVAMLADVGFDVRRMASSERGRAILDRAGRLYSLVRDLIDDATVESDGDDAIDHAEAALASLRARVSSPAVTVEVDEEGHEPVPRGDEYGQERKAIDDLLALGMKPAEIVKLKGFNRSYVYRRKRALQK